MTGQYHSILSSLRDTIQDVNRNDGKYLLAFFIKQLKQEHQINGTNSYLHRMLPIKDIKLPETCSWPKPFSNSEAELYTFMLQDKTVLRSQSLLQIMVDRLSYYDRNSEGIEFSTLLRTLCALTCENKIPLNVQERFCISQPKEIGRIIRLLLDRNDDITCITFDTEYFGLQQLCRRCSCAFHAVTEQLAEMMIKEGVQSAISLHIRQFIIQFLSGLQDQMKASEFKAMYAIRLRNYVLILSESSLESHQLGEYMLTELKMKNYRDFVLLLTHFPKYFHLMPQ